ncbi:NB-ARC domain protein [Leptolyngbya sp. PCC 7375]|nr:NB-ARC domain protein [Leptolyngbya sp. PCC 7375]
MAKKLNTSKNAQILAKKLLTKLIAYANYQYPEDVYLPSESKISTRWVRNKSSYPQLIVRSKRLDYLIELVEGAPIKDRDRLKVLKDQMRNVVRVLEQHLGILEDNRTKRQGSSEWLFTITLWSDASIEDNLYCLEARWNEHSHFLPKDSSKKIIFKVPKHTSIFTGREHEIKKIFEYISLDYRAHIIIVSGIGGIGKTTLILEVAHRCKKAAENKISQDIIPRFDAIIFTTYKENYVPSKKKESSIDKKRSNIQNIFRAISQTLDETITQKSGEEQVNFVYQCLKKQRTLLIVDNFNAIDGGERKDFALFLDNLPFSTKVIITTREKQSFLSHLELGRLSRNNSLYLIKKEANRKQIKLSESEALDIYRQYAGIPLALILSVARRANPDKLHSESDARILLNNFHMLQTDDDEKVHDSIQKNFDLIRDNYAHKISMSLSIFRKDAAREALAKVSDINDSDCLDDGLEELDKFSIINQTSGRYRLLPPVREYALAELNKYPSFRNNAEERWVKWYLDFVNKNGGKDWKDWDQKYEKLNKEWKNIISVIEYCAHREDNIFNDIEPYNVVFTLWFLVSPFASLYGYWSDRINWLDWIIEESEQRGDIHKAVEAMSDKGYTLALMNKLKDADSIVSQAWDLSKDLCPTEKVCIAHNRAFIFIRKKDYDNANNWLQKEEEMLHQSDFKERDKKRRQTAILYYNAETLFHNAQSSDYHKKSYIKQAKRLYQAVENYSGQIGWQRMKNNAQNRLAEIAIEEGHFLRASELLQTISSESKHSKDRWGIASYEATLARLAAKRGETDECEKWANAAQEKFCRLGMKREEQEMGELISYSKLLGNSY